MHHFHEDPNPMNDLAPRLSAFHRIVRELAAETARLNGVPDEMRALHDEYMVARADIDALGAAAEEAARERRDREGAVADAQEKLKKFQQQVPRVRNQREYGALLTEIDSAKSSLRALEEGMLETLERAESTARELVEKRAAHAGLEERYNAALAEWEARKPEVAARVHELERESEALRAALPRNFIVQYERIAARYGGEALSELQGTERPGGGVIWHCGTCNYQLRPQIAVEIRSHGAVVQCEGCKRFLVAAAESLA
jgi:predicted  nucleic acid-binding Zn-ribbon protein